MRQAGTGEYGQLLAADQSVQSVNGGYAGLDELGGVGAGGGVHRQAVDVHVRLGKYRRAAVYGLTHAVENTSEHVLADSKLLRMAEEADLRLGKVYALRRFEQLYDSLVAFDLEDFAAADFAVGELKLAQLVVSDAFNILDHHQRAGDLSYSLILFDHASSPPAITASISAFISSTMAA